MALQALAIGVTVLAGWWGGPWPSGAEPVAGAVGVVLLLGGIVLAVAGVGALGSSLTPYPAPGDDATLREHGSYRLVRHPIYGGLLLSTLGWALLTSPWALLGPAMLGIVLIGKSIREEAWLAERYPGYAAYRERVRRRFVPFVW